MSFALTMLSLYFVLMLINKLSMKWASDVLDARTAPIFTPAWILLGLAVTFPLFKDVAMVGYEKMQLSTLGLVMAIVKGFGFYAFLIYKQRLSTLSLSSTLYGGPIAVALAAIGASFLGEDLNIYQWMAIMALGLSGVAFMLKGHIRDVQDPKAFTYFFINIMLAAFLIVVDHTGVLHSNWYAFLAVSNGVTLILALILNVRSLQNIKSAFFARPAIIAGFIFVTFELVKFYQIVTITPATVMGAVALAGGPIVMVLSALIWKERTVKEQLLWGLWAVLMLIPLIFLK